MTTMQAIASISNFARRSRSEENYGKDHSLNYLIAIAAIGLFFSVMTVAFTGLPLAE